MPRKISPTAICKTGAIAIYTAGRLAKVSASKAITPRQNETKQMKNTNNHLYTYTMRDFASGKTIIKTQITEPRLTGYVCVDRDMVLPEINSRGERLFRDANNRPYYAAVSDDGSHRQP